MALKDFIKNRLKGYSQSKFDDIVNELVSGWQYTRREAIDLMHANQELLDQLDKDGVDVKTIVAMLIVTERQKTHSKTETYSKSDTTKLSSIKSWAEIEELLTQIGFKKDKAGYHEGKFLNSVGTNTVTNNPKGEFFYHEVIMPKVKSYFLTCAAEDEDRGTFLGEDIVGCISEDSFTKSIYFVSTKETTIGDLKKIIEESNGEELLNVSGIRYLNFKVLKFGE